MSGLDHERIALIVAKSADNGRSQEVVGTGYFLTGNLVLTARHIAERPGCAFSVRAEPGGSEKSRWSDAVSCWEGVGDVDAMLLRTTRQFGDWEMPILRGDIDEGEWESAGYARAAANEKEESRKTLPLRGSFGTSLGQGFAELALQTEQNIAPNWEAYWKGVSGAPVFARPPGAQGMIGIITEANRALSNCLIGLPTSRLLDDIRFRSIIRPSFLGSLPSAPWCLVLTPENSASDLVGQAGDVLKDPRLRGLHRDPIEIPVLEAVRSVENWAATLDALARADYVIADVTAFEPAVMMLLGIRSVLRRGVTVSVTADELTAHSSAVPFNVQETRVLSLTDEESFYEDLPRALAEGAANLARDSNYLDLPAYHAVRSPRPETWAEDDAKTMLVLCPFSEDYSDFYRRKLRPIIRLHTANGGMKLLRMLDLKSPRLVGQALYEQLRWSSWCVVDWTGWRPNVFFELGVRLACSERDPLSIIQRGNARHSVGVSGTPPNGLHQSDLLMQLFNPVEYDRMRPRDALKGPLEAWPEPPARTNGRASKQQVLPSSATFEVAQASFWWERDPILTLPHVEQRQAAESIFGKDPEKHPEPLILFAGNDQFNAELDAAARERWIAAWLYLRHLCSADNAAEGIQAELGRVSLLVIYALTSSSDPRHVTLRKEIRQFLRSERARRAPQESEGAGD
jgi:hypothetical protein